MRDIEHSISLPAICRPIKSIAFLLGLTMLIYAFAWPGTFVWDDDTNILENPWVRGDIAVMAASQLGFIEPYPVFYASLRAQWLFFGEHSQGYLVVNSILHALNALLLALLLRTHGKSIAFLSAALFLVHPAAVHSVAWISQHKTILSTTFYLLSIVLFARYGWAGGRLSYTGALVFFVVGLLTKPTLVFLPLFILAAAERSKKTRVSVWLIRLLPWFIAALIAGLVRIYWQPPPALDDAVQRAGEGWVRWAVAGCSLWMSALKMALPAGLMMIYPRWDIASWTPWHLLPLVMALLVLFGAWRMRKKFLSLWLGILFFVLAMLPVSGLFDNTYFAFAQIANHWMYPGMLGLIPLFAMMIIKICAALNARGRRLAWLIPAGLVMIFTILAAREAYRFHDARHYYERAVREHPDNVIAQQNLANILLEQGDEEGALLRYREAVRIHPELWQAQIGAGKILAGQGKTQEAFDCFRAAYDVFSDSPEVNFHLGTLYGQAGMHEEAINHLGYSLQLNPADPVAWYNFGAAWQAAGETANARAAFEQSLALDPTYPQPARALRIIGGAP